MKADLWGSIGTDVRYGITSGITLDATINPDFGQVEADPATLNLSAYEDYFRERRPLLCQGFRPLLYTRIIPSFIHAGSDEYRGHFSVPDDATELSRPESTTISGGCQNCGENGRRHLIWYFGSRGPHLSNAQN